MENNEWQKIWKSIDTGIKPRSEKELNLMLEAKSKKTINRFLVLFVVSALISAGVLLYLVITSLNRKDDLYFIIDNILLGVVTIISLFSGLWSWFRLKNNKYDQPLKLWLEERIRLLSKWLTGKYRILSLVLIPFIYVLLSLSINVYFENRPFVEVVRTEENVIGLLVGALVGLTVSYYVFNRIRKYQLKNLEFLNRLYQKLCEG
jgi:hypothetical protein